MRYDTLVLGIVVGAVLVLSLRNWRKDGGSWLR